MPPPGFCGKGPTAGHMGPAPTHPMMDFRRAVCPHAAAMVLRVSVETGGAEPRPYA